MCSLIEGRWPLVQIHRLLLPFALIIPLFNIATALAAVPSLFKCDFANLRKWQTVALGLVALVVHDLAVGVAILSTAQAFPNDTTACRMELQWKHWFQFKDDVAVRTIQDRLRCCGFNSMADRAWPFPSRTVDARTCERTSRYTTHCGPLWQEQLRTVAAVCIVASLLNMFLLVCDITSWSNNREGR